MEEEDTADEEEQVTNIVYFTFELTKFELKYELTIVLMFSYVIIASYIIINIVDNNYK